MASQDARERQPTGAPLQPDADHGLLGPAATRLSWALGDRVLGADPPRTFDCEHVSSAARITGFDATETTSLVRVRTPVGRERFYEIPTDQLATRQTELANHANWEVVYES